MSTVAECLFMLVQKTLCWERLLLKKRLSKRLPRFSLKRRNPTYIIAGNTADTWGKTSSKN